MGRYPRSPEELSSWADHFRTCPPDWVLLKRLCCELVELRVLLFNINRDPQKSGPIVPEQIAPDLFGKYDPEKYERQALDDFGSKLMAGLNNGRDGNT